MTFILIDKSLSESESLTKGMCGDINLFLQEKGGEIEIMVAKKESQRKGIAKESLFLFMKYCFDQLGIHFFIAKILDSNFPSIHLFEQIGFKKTQYIQVFQEYHYTIEVDLEYFQK